MCFVFFFLSSGPVHITFAKVKLNQIDHVDWYIFYFVMCVCWGIQSAMLYFWVFFLLFLLFVFGSSNIEICFRFAKNFSFTIYFKRWIKFIKYIRTHTHTHRINSKNTCTLSSKNRRCHSSHDIQIQLTLCYGEISIRFIFRLYSIHSNNW